MRQKIIIRRVVSKAGNGAAPPRRGAIIAKGQGLVHGGDHRAPRATALSPVGHVCAPNGQSYASGIPRRARLERRG